MATAPMDSEDPALDPTVGEAAETEAEPPQGTSSDYTIEIRVSGQGIKISVEPASEEDAEATPDEGDAQEVGSIGEAIRVVKEIYNRAGEMQTSGESQGEMDAGYR